MLEEFLNILNYENKNSMLYKTTIINLNNTFNKKNIKKWNEINEVTRWNKNLFIEKALYFIINELEYKLEKRKNSNKIKLLIN